MFTESDFNRLCFFHVRTSRRSKFSYGSLIQVVPISIRHVRYQSSYCPDLSIQVKFQVFRAFFSSVQAIGKIFHRRVVASYFCRQLPWKWFPVRIHPDLVFFGMCFRNCIIGDSSVCIGWISMDRLYIAARYMFQEIQCHCFVEVN